MSLGKVNGSNIFTVQVHGGAVTESNDGQDFLGGRLDVIAQDFAAIFQALADVLLRDDCACFAK